MTPDGDLSPLTLEQFRRGAASPHPMPAGVAIAAVSASFALGLVAKVLAVSARRNTLPQNTAGLEPVTAAAQAASQRMLQLAGADTAAFEAYLTAKRLPRATETERRARQEAIDVAVRHAIDLPLAAAQEAAAGLQLCSDGCRFVPPALAADVGVAATLLASALRSFLLCAQSNVRQLAPDAASYRERLAIETKRHEQALRQAEAVLGHARTVVAEAPMAGVQP
ncbi:MAG TPA: cyclodeaminase/cyclohydrolase family protein [Steroidobacteraceae bacterium]|nr:cyclodeaminase/cyclohydrolase family protein [Steroidobacteraceae bacterium]